MGLACSSAVRKPLIGLAQQVILKPALFQKPGPCGILIDISGHSAADLVLVSPGPDDHLPDLHPVADLVRGTLAYGNLCRRLSGLFQSSVPLLHHLREIHE